MLEVSTPLPIVGTEPSHPLEANAFLHVGPDRIYNPVSDRLLEVGEPGYGELRQVLSGGSTVAQLLAPTRDLLAKGLWLVPEGQDGRGAYRLKYVSLESHTVCNQSCYFCPVAYAPRDAYFMPTELYERILSELSAYRDTIEGVFMINYNEPTLDKRFVEQVRAIKEAGLPPATLTNASGLTPPKVDALCEMGGLSFLSINISTMDPEKYKKDRGVDQIDQIVRNLDYMANLPVAEVMEMVVLGEGDDAHDRSFEQIQERYGASRFKVEARRLMDRAGYLQIGNKASLAGKKLCGCENIGSRPLQHLHITPQGKCVLCCEDYDENYVVGDLTEKSVDEILAGEAFARLRRWAYSLEESPSDFMCRNCIYALAE